MNGIRDIQILNSRGNPTVEAEVTLEHKLGDKARYAGRNAFVRLSA
jgi:enolase